MPDSLGPVPIPVPPTVSAFPFSNEFGGGFDYTPPIATHVFDQPGLKTEQRYLLGSGVRRFRVVRSRGLACQEYDALKAHFLAAQGSYAQFPYTHYIPTGAQNVTARYENPNIAFEHLVGMLCGDPGITLIEVPAVTPAYTSALTVTRFPDSTLTGALRGEVQQFIPLVTITPRVTPTYTTPDVIRISNQRCTVDSQLYLPRLLEWSGITQTLGEASDQATFTFGNADDVWVTLGNQINLYRARVSFALFHVNTNYLIKFWSGYARPWNMTSDGKFILPTSDGVFELGIPYPSRTISRQCWKDYKGRFCPSTSSFPDCPKDFDSCTARGVPLSFGGLIATDPQVRIREQSTGVIGYGRSFLASISVANDTIYQRPVQEVYTDEDMILTADVAMGRDENEFYSAIGVVSEGPIGGYPQNTHLQTLDSQPPHDPFFYGGWRGILGTDPAITTDFFAIDQDPWGVPPPGSTWSAGLAFAEIRRTDAAGTQLLPVADRKMMITVSKGIGGWIWASPGVRTWQPALTNCIWVAINVYLRGIGLRLDHARESQIPAATMEQYFDVTQAIAMAAICDLTVDKIVGPGTERQFPFRGVLKEQKPLKDWLTEILNCCLGYYTFVDGKLWVGIRHHSNAVLAGAFSQATILFSSLQASPLAPQFNWLDGQFGDEEFAWQLNTVSIYDIDCAKFMGDGQNPMYTRNSMTFVGISNKSQCARVITTRLREEIGGITLDEQRNARNLQFKTTLLAMELMVGDIVSLTHPRLPGGVQHARVQHWTLNPDYSVDVVCSATTASMYALDAGPVPTDVAAPPVPPELLSPAQGLAWMPNHLAPFASDPLYPDILERTFDLWQDYNITKDGNWEPAIVVAGEQVINHMVTVQPRITGVILASGGSLAGPQVVYAAVTQHSAASGRAGAPKTNAATFIGYDTTTKGTWKGVYGSDGGNIQGEPGLSYPSYVTTSGWAGASTYAYSIGTVSDFPQKPSDPSPAVLTRNCYYDSGSGTGAEMTLDLVITDGQPHTLAAYLLDADGYGGGRQMRIYITDLSGTMLDDRGTFNDLNPNPRWVKWTITGSVRVHLATQTATNNATMFGVFFSPAAVTPPPTGGEAVYTLPSNLIAVYIPAGATGQALQLTMSPAAGAWTDWDLHVGNDRRQMPLQLSAAGALPSSYTFNGPIHPMTREMPEGAARRVRIAAKHVWHSGVAGVSVTGVTLPNVIQCNDFKDSTDTWAGRVVSALADFSDGSAPLWNFTVTAFNSSTGELTVSPGFAADPVGVGDVLIMRSIATSADASSVTDTMWANYVTNHQFGNNGLIPLGGGPDEEKGRLVRILRGKGAGQVRQIVGNTATTISVHPDWDVIPNNTSIVIVEEASYPSSADTSDFDVPRPGINFEQRLRVENLANEVALVTGYLVDDQGRITDEEFTVNREIYIYGEPPGVRIVGPAANDPATSAAWLINENDQTIRGDTSTNDVNVKLLPLASYHGRTLTMNNDNGPHNMIVTPASGELLFDAQTSVVIAPLETVRFTAG